MPFLGLMTGSGGYVQASAKSCRLFSLDGSFELPVASPRKGLVAFSFVATFEEGVKFMNTTTKTFAIALVGLSIITPPAQAKDLEGLYIQGGIGASWLSDADNTGAGFDIESDFESGIALSGAIGKQLNENIRLEAELGYQKNDSDSLSVVNDAGLGLIGTTLDADGDVSALSVMGNVYYDLLQTNTTLVPYVTAGLGFARIDADISSGGTEIVSDDDTVLAYKIGAGFGYGLKENLTLDVGYRYFGTQDPELTAADGTEFESEYDSHTIKAGVRYAF